MNIIPCSTCDTGKAVHQLSYYNFIAETDWVGNYCNGCFVKKLRGMANVWSKRK